MNVTLMPNDVNLDFYFNPPEIYKSDEDIKSCFFNTQGSIIAIVTKTNLIKIFDFIGKSCVFTIPNFKDESIINFISWSDDSKNIYITYEDKEKISKIKIIKLNFFNPNNYYEISDDIVIYSDPDVKSINTSARLSKENFLIISGAYPKIYDLSTGEFFNFFKDENLKVKSKPNYTFIINETLEITSYFLFAREISMFFLLKENNEKNIDKYNYAINSLKERKLTNDQANLFDYVKNNLSEFLLIIDFYTINTNGEILQANLDSSKNLILLNSSDRFLRLFNYNFDSINLIKEFSDSVNRKKWINAYFYSFKIKSNYQDVIVSALSDVNTLEFIFIDINTGKFIKNMEPFKYQCSDFICHYINHYSIVLISNKKLFHIYGYLVNHFGALAPQFQYIEENIAYIEEEDFFDSFKKNFKTLQAKKEEVDKSKILNILKETNFPEIDKNIFICYSPVEDDCLALQSEKEVKELFQNFNDVVEINKYDSL